MKGSGSKFTKIVVASDEKDRLAWVTFGKSYSQVVQKSKFHLYRRILSILHGPKLTGLNNSLQDKIVLTYDNSL